MSDNHDDDILETGDLDSDGGLDDFDSGGGASLSDAVKSNPMVKIGIVVGAIAVIVGGIVLFGGKKEAVAPSTMTRGVEVKAMPTEGKVSPVYEEAIKEVNQQVAEKAKMEGGSAIPVPITQSRSKASLEEQQKVEEDPLERWRRIQEERLKKEKEEQAKIAAKNAAAQASSGPAPKPVDPNAELKKVLQERFAEQMGSVLETTVPVPPESIVVAKPDYLEEKRKAAQEAQRVEEQAQAEGSAAAGEPVEILLEAGRIEYAQLITEANSDAPGPVLVELASGPLAGSRMIGSFKATDDYLVLTFKTIVVDGVGYTTDAIALDPGTANPGLVTDIDRKYFQRIILPAAAAFIEGMGAAIAETGTSVSVDEGTSTQSTPEPDTTEEFYKGVEKAAEKVGEVLEKDNARVKPLVRVAAGTHVGILFMEPVQRGGADLVAANQAQQQVPVTPTGIPQFILQQVPTSPIPDAGQVSQ